MLHFLLVVIDGGDAASAFAHCFPPLDRAQERDFRRVAEARVAALEKARLIPLGCGRKSVVASGGGARFEMLVACLSTLALKKLSARHPAHAVTHSLVVPVRNAFNASPGSYAKQLRTRIAAERVVFARTTQVGKGSGERWRREVDELEGRVERYRAQAEALRRLVESEEEAGGGGEGGGRACVPSASASGSVGSAGTASRSASGGAEEGAVVVDMAAQEAKDRKAIDALLQTFCEFARLGKGVHGGGGGDFEGGGEQYGDGGGGEGHVLEGGEEAKNDPVDIIQVIAQATDELRKATVKLQDGGTVGHEKRSSTASEVLKRARRVSDEEEEGDTAGERNVAVLGGQNEGAGGTTSAASSGGQVTRAFVSDISCESVETLESPSTAKRFAELKRRSELCSDQDVDVDIQEDEDEVDEGPDFVHPGPGGSGTGSGTESVTGSGGGERDDHFFDASEDSPVGDGQGKRALDRRGVAEEAAENPCSSPRSSDGVDLFADTGDVLESLERHRALLDASMELTAEAAATAVLAREESRGLLESPVTPSGGGGASETQPGDDDEPDVREVTSDQELVRVFSGVAAGEATAPRPEARRQLLGVRPSTPPPKWTSAHVDFDEEEEATAGGVEGMHDDAVEEGQAEAEGEAEEVKLARRGEVDDVDLHSVQPMRNDIVKTTEPSSIVQSPKAESAASPSELSSRIAFFNTLDSLRDGAAVAKTPSTSAASKPRGTASSRRLLGVQEAAPVPSLDSPVASRTLPAGFAGAGAINSWNLHLVGRGGNAGGASLLDASMEPKAPSPPLISALSSADEHLKKRVPRAVRFAQLPMSASAGSSSSSTSTACGRGDVSSDKSRRKASPSPRRGTYIVTVDVNGDQVERASDEPVDSASVAQPAENGLQAQVGPESGHGASASISGRDSEPVPGTGQTAKRLERRSTPLKLGRLLVPRGGSGGGKGGAAAQARSGSKPAQAKPAAAEAQHESLPNPTLVVPLRPPSNTSGSVAGRHRPQIPVVKQSSLPATTKMHGPAFVPNNVTGPSTGLATEPTPKATTPTATVVELPVDPTELGVSAAPTANADKVEQSVASDTAGLDASSSRGGTTGHMPYVPMFLQGKEGGPNLASLAPAPDQEQAAQKMAPVERAGEVCDKAPSGWRGTTAAPDCAVREIKRSEGQSRSHVSKSGSLLASKSGSLLSESNMSFQRRLFASPESGSGHKRSVSVGGQDQDQSRTTGFRSTSRAKSELAEARMISFSNLNGQKGTRATMVLCSSGDDSDEELEMSGGKLGSLSERAHSDLSSRSSPTGARGIASAHAAFGTSLHSSAHAAPAARPSLLSNRFFSASPSPSRDRATRRESSSRPSAAKKASTRIKNLRDRFRRLS